MDPVVKFYLTWGAIAVVVAVVLYVGMGMKGETQNLAPPLRAAAALGMAIVIVVLPSRSSRWGSSRSAFTREYSQAQNQSAADQSIRANGQKLLESSKTKTDMLTVADLIREGNSLQSRGYPADALALHDRAHQILLAKSAGNGDWNVDSWMLQLLPNYQVELKAAGRAREAGALIVVEQSLRSRHAGKIK